MTTDLKTVKKCLYWNVGYCKYSDKGCKYFHPDDNCEKSFCNDKSCQKRHKRFCKHGSKCKFLKDKSCAFKHDRQIFKTAQLEETPMDAKLYLAEIDMLKCEIEALKKKVSEKEKQVICF